MADIQRLEMPVELGLKLRAVVGLNDVHAEWKATQDFVVKCIAVRWLQAS